MQIDPKIFKAYDIRGVYPEEMNEDIAYNIGRAIAAFTGARRVVVGRDTRLSSEAIENAVVKGLSGGGADVVKIGLASTPLVYFASGRLDVDAGVIVTASHNPAEYNGFKLCRSAAVPIGEGTGMEEIKALAMNAVFADPAAPGRVSENPAVKESYLAHIQSFFNQPGAQKKKIVIDFGNGMGIIDKPAFENLRAYLDPAYLYDDLDGSFPNHEPNPLKTETMADLQKKVVSANADLGISYDGDADRVGFVDEQGEIVPMDFITALIAEEMLKKHPGGLVLVDLRSSNAVREYIEKAGGRVDLCRVGHSLIKKQMREEGAIFAGELSGHYYFDENYKAELSTLAVLMIINFLNETGRPMSELVSELKKYYHSGEINSAVENKEAVMLKLREIYAAGRLNELDGVRIDFDDWWFNVRPSNTEPKLRLNVEAKTREMMEEKRDEILKIIRS